MKRLGILVLISGLLAGCGYHFRPTGEPVGISIDSLAIPLFRSTSVEKGFEAVFTKVLREEFASHGKVPLVPEEKAQYLLTGRVYDIWTDPVSYSFQEQTVRGHPSIYEETNRRRLRLRVEVSLVERETGRVVWHEKAMETRTSFELTSDPLQSRYEEDLALEKIARRLAKRIYMMTMERF
ncbi:MAG: LPS assembly lipoprotein LptE [Thermodesulfobacteriota bacterium]